MWQNDEEMTTWIESQLESSRSGGLNHEEPRLSDESIIVAKLAEHTRKNVINDIKYIVETYPDIALESLNHLIEFTSADRLKVVVDVLSKKLQELEASQELKLEPANENATTNNENNNQQTTNETTATAMFSVSTINTSTPKIPNNSSRESTTTMTQPTSPTTTTTAPTSPTSPNSSRK